jgi:hypothetical protein
MSTSNKKSGVLLLPTWFLDPCRDKRVGMKIIQCGIFVHRRLHPGSEVSCIEGGFGQQVWEQFFICSDGSGGDLN